MLAELLHHRNGFVRKGAALALRVPRRAARAAAGADDYAARPPVLANSFPKSGTHLLDQILEALPNQRNYGEFLSSMTSSFQFRRATDEQSAAALRTAVPGELVRSHLFCEPATADAITATRFVHYFIYRDPRDVALSEAHYYRTINRWHRLHKHFAAAESLEAAIELAIAGLPELTPEIYYPPIGQRFEHYAGWIGRDDVFAVKFSDLTSERQGELLRQMADFYAQRTTADVDAAAIADAMAGSVDPSRSHTYRKGSSGGWQASFTDRHRELFKEHCGDVLVTYGFETDKDW